jgi:hypothetical protein
MLRNEIERIFSLNREALLEGQQISSSPLAVLLGGQPASGKSTLTRVAENENPDKKFIKVNGDEYRIFHPEHDSLIGEIAAYSEKTQPFSNVFTEKLIEEAIKNKFNIIVEGTMRNPDIPLKTSAMFKTAGFKVEAYVIAAPALFTEAGIYFRYCKEMQAQGYGRLSDINSHNFAVTGLLKSVNALYRNKATDKISIHTYMASEKIKDFYRREHEWNCYIPPADFITQARNKQLKNNELISACIKQLESLSNVPKEMELSVSRIINELNREKLSMHRGYSR